MILCNECGNPLGEQARFCAECGTSVLGDAGLTSAHVQHEEHSGEREYWESISDSESEHKLWDAIRNSNDAEEFHKYLKAFPDGAFATIARAKLRSLRGLSRREFFNRS